MAVTGTLLCMMSAVFATGLLMLCDSAVVKTRSPLYHMNYVTYPPSTTLLTGTPYYFGTYPTMPPMPTRQNYCIRDGWENLFIPTLVLTVSVPLEDILTA